MVLLCRYTYLQLPTDQVTTDFIIDQYKVLHDAYIADRALIPDDRLVEVSFEQLDGSPVATMQHIYTKLGYSDSEFEQVCGRTQSSINPIHQSMSPF